MVTGYQIVRLRPQGSEQQQDARISGRSIGEMLVEESVLPGDNAVMVGVRKMLVDLDATRDDQP